MLNIPHVFRRSARRGGRRPRQEGENQAIVARVLAAQLGTALDKAEGAGLQTLAYLLDMARIEAERVAGERPDVRLWGREG